MNVPAAFPISFRVPINSTVTFINQEAGGGSSVFISDDRARLINTVGAPDGDVTEIAAGKTVFQWPAFKGIVWLRANPTDVTKLAVLYS